MKKTIIILLSIIIFLLVVFGFLSAIVITGKAVQNFQVSNNLSNLGNYDPSKIPLDYSYTTAICNNNKCRDFVVTCLDGEAINIDPVSGMVIFPSNWEDLREERNGLCGD